MAHTIMCSQHEDTAAQLLVTNCDNGDTIGLCPECIPAWMIGMLQAGFPDALQHLVESNQASKEEVAKPAPERPTRRLKRDPESNIRILPSQAEAAGPPTHAGDEPHTG